MLSKELFKKVNLISNSLAQARKKNFLINSLPTNILRNLDLVKQIRSFAEAKLEWHPVGFKIGGTNPEIMRLLKAKEPFYSYLFREQTFNNKLCIILGDSDFSIYSTITSKKSSSMRRKEHQLYLKTDLIKLCKII